MICFYSDDLQSQYSTGSRGFQILDIINWTKVIFDIKVMTQLSLIENKKENNKAEPCDPQTKK